MLTHARLLKMVDYNPGTGVFTWRIAPKKGPDRTGLRAGTVSKIRPTCTRPYRQIRIDGKTYFEHRLAWFHVHGRWPQGILDHINFDSLDNRIANLREATHSTNKANRPPPKNNSTGYKGVSFNKVYGKFQASICRQYKQMHLGFFDAAEEAHAAYRAAAVEL